MDCKRYAARILAVMLVAAMPLQAMAQCMIKDQMTQVQQAEWQRQMTGLDQRFQQLVSMNSIQRQCLNALPLTPSDTRNSQVMSAVVNQLRNQICSSLAGKINSAQRNVTNRYDNAVNGATRKVTDGLDPNLMREIQNQAQDAANGRATTDSVSDAAGRAATNSITDRLRNLFR